MPKIKYVAGDSGAEEVEAFGYKFTSGKSAEVKDEDVFKFNGNPYFEQVGAKTDEPKASEK